MNALTRVEYFCQCNACAATPFVWLEGRRKEKIVKEMIVNSGEEEGSPWCQLNYIKKQSPKRAVGTHMIVLQADKIQN